MFSDEFAPVWRDPETNELSVWTSTRFKAAGYEVAQVREDLYVVDLDSRKPALPSNPASGGGTSGQ
jgi:hypothetical protein